MASGDAAREESIRHGLDNQEYVDAKCAFETDQELLLTMKKKQMKETIALKMPANSVEIHDEPVLSDAPVSPNVFLNLTIGTVLGLLLSPLLALPVMLGSHRWFPAKATP